MSFELERATVLELDLDKCNLNYGAGACTAGTDVHTGTSQAGATANTIKLAAGASGTDDIYNGDAITLADGRRAVITDYDGTSKVATVDRNWPINILTRSEELDHADWTKTRASITADNLVAPDGAITADKLIEDGTSSATHNVNRSISYTTGLAYKLTIEGRADERSEILLAFDTAAFPGNAHARFDLAAGTVLETGSGADSARVELSAQGYYRCTLESTADVTTSAVTTIFLSVAGAQSYNGDSVSGLHLHSAHLRLSTDPDEYVRAVASAIALPDSVAYRIISVGGECYNTFQTCQDKANYEKAGQTWSFCNAGADVPSGQQIRPYIQPRGVSTAATEINLEKGLAPRANVKVKLADEPSSDIEADKYSATRSSAAQGSFFSRLMARNRNYAGRFARLKTAYFTAGWSEADFVNELYIIEKIDGPDSKASMSLTLKDPIKLTDRAKVPAASSGLLLNDITAGSTTIPLREGDGAGYTSTGHVRVGDEVIKYTTNSGDVLGGLTRATFGTTADEADAGDGVQQCKVYESQQPWQVLEDLLLSSGLPAANIDSAGFQSEDDTWLGDGWEITTCLSEPEKASKQLAELVVQVGGFMWFDPATQQARFRILAPLHPDDTVAGTLTDTNSIVEGSVKITVLEDLRRTQQQIWYDRISVTADGDEGKNFRRLRFHVDADAEGANDYDDTRPEIIYSRWYTITNDAAVGTVASHRIGYYRDAPKNIEIAVDAKDADIREGDYVDLQTAGLTDVTGAAELTRCLVLKRKDEGGRIRLKLRAINFGARYAFIAPDATGDYPTDPQWVHINPDTEFFDDGEPGYQAF